MDQLIVRFQGFSLLNPILLLAYFCSRCSVAFLRRFVISSPTNKQTCYLQLARNGLTDPCKEDNRQTDIRPQVCEVNARVTAGIVNVHQELEWILPQPCAIVRVHRPLSLQVGTTCISTRPQVSVTEYIFSHCAQHNSIRVSVTWCNVCARFDQPMPFAFPSRFSIAHVAKPRKP